MTQFKIWYIHQVPGRAFEREVPSPEVGQEILDAIYDLSLFQYENDMIPDYANTGGIVYLDEDGEWIDYDPEDIPEWIDDSVEYKPGDRAQVLVGGPHENYLRVATVNRVQESGEVVLYFGDQDEDEWLYSPSELRRVTK